MVSIHAPREGCDVKFRVKIVHPNSSFNSRTPGGVRPICDARLAHSRSVSIHAPREGCDWELFKAGVRHIYEFQFTHPGRGATEPSAR